MGCKSEDIYGDTISTTVYISSSPSIISELSTPMHHQAVPLNIKEEALLHAQFQLLIHLCNYKFSTVWKTLVDNFLHLCINRVES